MNKKKKSNHNSDKEAIAVDKNRVLKDEFD